MGNQFQTFVINLASGVDRRAFMAQQLKAADVSFEIVDAVNGKALTAEEVAAAYDDAGARVIQQRPLSRGEIGCALSHVSIYHEVISRGLSAALILEDDARLNDAFGNLVKPLAQSMAREQQPTIYLLTHLMRYKRKSRAKIGPNHALHPILDPCCAHGYMLNGAAAREMIKIFSPVRYPIDAWRLVAETHKINVLGLNPYVIGHSEFSKDSNLETDRDAIDHAFQPTGWERLRFYLRFYGYEKFYYQLYKLMAGIKKQHKQNWDLR